MEKLLRDIFSMRFDIVIPLSSCLIALVLAGVLFSIRFFSYRKNKRRYERRLKQEEEDNAAAESATAESTTAESTDTLPDGGEVPGS